MEWDRKKRKFDWKRAIQMKGVHESMKSEDLILVNERSA